MLKRCLPALLLTGLLCAVTPTFAQDNSANGQQSEPMGGPPNRGGGHFDPTTRAEMLARHLNLTPDQKTKVVDILKTAQTQIESLHSDTSTPPQERHSKMMEIHKASDDQIRAILDPTQQKKWDMMQNRRQQQMQGRGPGGQVPPPPDSSQPQ